MAFPTPAELVALLEKLSNHVGALTTALSQQDGARMAHRHILAELLADLPDSRVANAVEDLTTDVDSFEEETGQTRAASYRAELDTLLAQTRTVRRNR